MTIHRYIIKEDATHLLDGAKLKFYVYEHLPHGYVKLEDTVGNTIDECRQRLHAIISSNNGDIVKENIEAVF